MSIRGRIATALRGIAQALDGREFMDAKWHRHSVRQMNSYIEHAEGFMRKHAEAELEKRPSRRGVHIP